jgi:hypothetical protein
MARMPTLPPHQQSWRGPRLIDDETFGKMEHPDFILGLDLGHPPGRLIETIQTSAGLALIDGRCEEVCGVAEECADGDANDGAYSCSDPG